MSSPGFGNQLLYPIDYRTPQAAQENFLSDFSMRAFNAGRQLYARGKHLHALMAFKYGLLHDPSELRLHLMIIVTYQSLNKIPEAVRHLEILRRLNLSPEAAQAVKETIENWAHVPDALGDLPLSARNDPPMLTTSMLGMDGAFGNQIFQYAFAKIYSGLHGLRFECDEWIGQKLFGLRDPAVSKILPFILEIEFLRDDVLIVPPLESGLCDRDSQGYFQFNTKCYVPHRDRFRSCFRPISVVEWMLKAFVADIRKQGETLVAVHLRRRDAAAHGRETSIRIYAEWLRALWPTLEKPVLFLASDDLEGVRRDLAEFSPITSEHIRLPVPDAGFYPDFYVMTQADYLAAGNSTFSFAASMLNERARLCVRPDRDNSRLAAYDPWGAAPTV